MSINGDASLDEDDDEVVPKTLKNLKRNTNSARTRKRKEKKKKGLIKQDLRNLLIFSPLGPSKKVVIKLKDQSPEELREI